MTQTPTHTDPWTPEQALAWYSRQGWLLGFNYVTSSAVNTTEMWQAETFDPRTIDQELRWANQIGYNTCRVFLQFLVWRADREGFLRRMGQFLDIAQAHRLRVMFVPFDDCSFSGKQPYLGVQDAPIPGVHNSGWVGSPGSARVTDPAAWPELQAYIGDVVGRFARDERVVLWDLYNEPGNEGMGEASLPLVEAAFAWARSAGPIAPLSVGIWNPGQAIACELFAKLSDVITFHSYSPPDDIRAFAEVLGRLGRPIICTEWLRRPECPLEPTLSFFKAQNIGCYHWGLVNGKTQTHFPWGSKPGAPEPELWFHDLLDRSGRPKYVEEFIAIQRVLGRVK